MLYVYVRNMIKYVEWYTYSPENWNAKTVEMFVVSSAGFLLLFLTSVTATSVISTLTRRVDPRRRLVDMDIYIYMSERRMVRYTGFYVDLYT